MAHIVAARRRSCGVDEVTIVAGFSASRQGSAPLHLAAQLARTTGEKLIAAAILENSAPVGVDQVEHEYLRHLTAQTIS